MNSLLAVMLVCATSVPRDECTRKTAIDVLETPARTASACLTWSQTTAGGLGLIDVDTYLVTRCEPQRREAAAQ